MLTLADTKWRLSKISHYKYVCLISSSLFQTVQHNPNSSNPSRWRHRRNNSPNFEAFDTSIIRTDFMYNKDEIFALDIMDTAAVLTFSETTLKIRKINCNFPRCININEHWINSIGQDHFWYIFSLTVIILLQIYL